MPAKPHYRERTKIGSRKPKITPARGKKTKCYSITAQKALAFAMQAESSWGREGEGAGAGEEPPRGRRPLRPNQFGKGSKAWGKGGDI